jgi:hypothetical protein
MEMGVIARGRVFHIRIVYYAMVKVIYGLGSVCGGGISTQSFILT